MIKNLSSFFSLLFIIPSLALAKPVDENQLYVAVGSMSENYGMSPLLAFSHDAGNSWTYEKTISANFYGNLSGVSCKGNICAAVGDFQTRNFQKKGLLIAISKDNGKTWSYPTEIVNEAKIQHESSSWFTSISCSSEVCIAGGIYRETQEKYGEYKPLLAVSKDGENWTYPSSFYSLSLPSNFFAGYFTSVSCTGHVCIAAGSYKGNEEDIREQPLLAVSRDSGKTWEYPESIHSTTSLPAKFRWGYFKSASCSDQICIASGSYSDTENYVTNKPLLAMSQDGGKTWTYPQSIISALPKFYEHAKLDFGASCSNKLCIASGNLYNKDTLRPLVAMTQDGGNTWSYPSAIYEASAVKDGMADLEGGASCNGNNCILGGSHGFPSYPLVAITKDAGKTWTYPGEVSSIFKLPLWFKEGHLNGDAICKNEVCMASGSYYDGSKERPLILITRDGGKTWDYPKQVYSLTALPKNFDHGSFAKMGINSASAQLSKSKNSEIR